MARDGLAPANMYRQYNPLFLLAANFGERMAFAPITLTSRLQNCRWALRGNKRVGCGVMRITRRELLIKFEALMEVSRKCHRYMIKLNPVTKGKESDARSSGRGSLHGWACAPEIK